MREPADRGNAADDRECNAAQPATVVIHEVEAIARFHAESGQEIAQLKIGKPVDRRISGVIRKLGTGRDRQAFIMALERFRVPTVEGQAEFVLRGAEPVGGADEEHATGPQDARKFLKALFPFSHMLKQFRGDADIHRGIVEGQRGGGGKMEVRVEIGFAQALMGDLDEFLIDVHPVDLMTKLRPDATLGAGVAADVGDIQRHPRLAVKAQQLIAQPLGSLA